MKGKKKKLSPLLEKIRFYFDVLQESSEAYYFVIDFSAGITLLSKRMADDFGIGDTVIGNLADVWLPLVHPADLPQVKRIDDEIRYGDGSKDHFNVEYRSKDRYGEYVWMRVTGKLLRDSEGKPQFFGGILNPLERLNQADGVTGLLNKWQFEMAVNRILKEQAHNGIGGRIMLLGLDNFRAINEANNRSFGDAVLRMTAKQLLNILPEGAMLYKLDSDEFGMILPGARTVQVAQVFGAIQACMSRQQFIDGKPYFCTMSAGTVAYPEDGKEYYKLFKHAEAALVLAKRGGKNQNVVLTHEQYSRYVRSMAMRDLLKVSVENNCEGFQLFYQPQIEARTKRLIGAEALLRWKKPDGKMVSPMEFIPILEETKMILPVGRWIVEEALKTCKKWRKIVPDFKMSINVSSVQIKDMEFFPFVREAIKAIGVPPQCVTLELTESTIVSDWNFINRQFNEFRDQGVQIAMDDFGTGYSSLAYLKNLSCDIVKVDREFVKNILENDFDTRLVEYTVTLCRSVGIRTCIEGVEENEVYEIVTNRCGADYIQGYLFGRPVSQDDFYETYLKELQKEVANDAG